MYGESRLTPETHNLRGQVAQIQDQAGVVTNDNYDFKKNLLRSQRQLAQEYKSLKQIEVVCEFAGSGKLYQKIEQGAQGLYGADVFLSASPAYIAKLEHLGLADNPQIFMRNDLVVGVVKP
jgi:hypothetical protein